MTSVRFAMTALGLAALALTALVVHDVHAADKDSIAKIAEALKQGKDADAVAAAKAYAKKNDAVDELMEGFGKKGLIAEGIEKKIRDFKKQVTAGDLANPDYKDIGVTTAAVGLVCETTSGPRRQQASERLDCDVERPEGKGSGSPGGVPGEECGQGEIGGGGTRGIVREVSQLVQGGGRSKGWRRSQGWRRGRPQGRGRPVSAMVDWKKASWEARRHVRTTAGESRAGAGRRDRETPGSP